MDKKTIGSFLAALRKANGLTQKQLAEKLNVSDKAVSRWERDECAPDLSLIPVLADIYGITSDEILRGQRNDPEAPAGEPDSIRTKKQVQLLLERTKTKFRIRSIIAIAIAIVGIIAAAICNHGLNQAAIGFMVGSIFFVTAIVCQIIFAILSFSAINVEDLDTDAVRRSKRSMALTTELTIGTIVIFLVGCSPLITITEGTPYFGLDADYVFEEGLSNTLLAAFICLVTGYIINLKSGYAKAPNISGPTLRLLGRCLGVLSIILVLIFVIQLCLNIFFLEKYHLYAPCQKFDTLDEFKEFVETPTDPKGNPLTLVDTTYEEDEYGYEITYFHYVSPTGDEYTLSNRDKSYLLPSSYEDGIAYFGPSTSEEEPFTAEYNYPFLRYNLSVTYIEISNDTEIVPIYVFTDDQFAKALDIELWVNMIFRALDLCAIITIALIFLKKHKQL